jgi:hypothetical protein
MMDIINRHKHVLDASTRFRHVRRQATFLSDGSSRGRCSFRLRKEHWWWTPEHKEMRHQQPPTSPERK